MVHCLCENAYGYHNVKYLRRYYNITTRQHELIEILHPHVLVVLPREQHMLNLFVNRSQCSPVIERPVCETPPSLCKATWDFQTIQDLAEVTVKYFHWFEMAAIIVALFLVSFLFRKSNLFLGVLGRHIARLTLEGSMGFLSTAEIMGVHQQQQENDQTRNPGQQPESDVHYDIFFVILRVRSRHETGPRGGRPFSRKPWSESVRSGTRPFAEPSRNPIDIQSHRKQRQVHRLPVLGLLRRQLPQGLRGSHDH